MVMAVMPPPQRFTSFYESVMLMHTVAAAGTYLANKPASTVLVCLIVAIVLFVVAAVAAVAEHAFWAALVAAGLVAVTLAFVLH